MKMSLTIYQVYMLILKHKLAMGAAHAFEHHYKELELFAERRNAQWSFEDSMEPLLNKLIGQLKA